MRDSASLGVFELKPEESSQRAVRSERLSAATGGHLKMDFVPNAEQLAHVLFRSDRPRVLSRGYYSLAGDNTGAAEYDVLSRINAFDADASSPQVRDRIGIYIFFFFVQTSKYAGTINLPIARRGRHYTRAPRIDGRRGTIPNPPSLRRAPHVFNLDLPRRRRLVRLRSRRTHGHGGIRVCALRQKPLHSLLSRKAVFKVCASGAKLSLWKVAHGSALT